MRRAMLGPLLAVALLGGGCSGGDGPVDDVDDRGASTDSVTVEELLDRLGGMDLEHDELLAELYRGAVTEPAIVQYGLSTGPEADAWIPAFEAEFPGVEVDLLALRAPDLLDRIAAEAGRGDLGADVVVTNAAGLGLLEDLGRSAAGVDRLLRPGVEAVLTTDRAVALWVEPYVIAWHTERASFEAPPRGWDDLVRASHGGCAISEGAPTWYAWAVSTWGEAGLGTWLEGLVANGGRLLTGMTPGARAAALAAGEVPCLAAEQLAVVERVASEGAPIAWTLPARTPAVVAGIAIDRATRSPHAAALLVAWAVGPGGARVVLESGLSPADARSVPGDSAVGVWLGGDGDFRELADIPDVGTALELQGRVTRVVPGLLAELGG